MLYACLQVYLRYRNGIRVQLECRKRIIRPFRPRQRDQTFGFERAQKSAKLTIIKILRRLRVNEPFFCGFRAFLCSKRRGEIRKNSFSAGLEIGFTLSLL